MFWYIGNKTPQEKFIENIHQTPFWEDVDKMYDLKKERIIYQNYKADLAIKLLKRSL